MGQIWATDHSLPTSALCDHVISYIIFTLSKTNWYSLLPQVFYTVFLQSGVLYLQLSAYLLSTLYSNVTLKTTRKLLLSHLLPVAIIQIIYYRAFGILRFFFFVYMCIIYPPI